MIVSAGPFFTFSERIKNGTPYFLQMYENIRDGNDTNLKGEIGELIAKHKLKSAFSTKQFYHKS